MPQPQASAEATVGQASVSIPAQATKRLAFALGLALLAWVLVQAWPALQTWPNLPRPDGHWLAASGALLGLAFLNGVGLWRLWLRAMGARLSYGEAFAVVHGSNLAKYLPGGLWHLVGGVVLAQRKGVQGPQGPWPSAWTPWVSWLGPCCGCWPAAFGCTQAQWPLPWRWPCWWPFTPAS